MINHQASRDKQLLAWERERETLRRRLHDPPVHPLAEPIQRGWKRQFVLTAEAVHQPDAPTLAAILAEINSVFYFWRRDFQPSRRALRSGRRTISNEQYLHAIGAEEWDRRNYPSVWRKYFRIELVPSSIVYRAPRIASSRQCWSLPRQLPQESNFMYALAFRFPRLFSLRVERNWLTHISEIEPDVVERVAELDAYINRHSGSHRLAWLRNRSYHNWRGVDIRQRVLRNFAVREMRAQLGALDQRDAPGGADAMPPPLFDCGGGMASAVFGRQQKFAAVRLEILRSKTIETETRESQRIPALWARVAGPGVSAAGREPKTPDRAYAVRAVPDGAQTADADCQSRVQANGPARLRSIFSANFLSPF